MMVRSKLEGWKIKKRDKCLKKTSTAQQIVYKPIKLAMIRPWLGP